MKDIEIISEIIKSYPENEKYIQLSDLFEQLRKKNLASDEKILLLIKQLIRNEVIVDNNYLPIVRMDKYFENIADANDELLPKEDCKVKINSFSKNLTKAIDSCPQKKYSLMHYQLKALQM